ncbi:MAG: FeoB-associated Cys-rich membrane protein [Acetatifactor sp.]
MENVIIVLLLAVLLVGAGRYIYRSKKAGGKCIGCPCAKSCRGGCGNKK